MFSLFCVRRVQGITLACALVLPPSAAAQPAAPAPSAASAGSAAQAPVAAPAPLPNRVNQVLPSWLQVRGEFRERIERVDGFGFNSSREDLYWLTRVRLNATVTVSTQLSLHAQVQDARVAKKSVGPTGVPFSAPFDLRQGFAEIGSAAGPVTVRIGRQELAYGEQRLVGHVGWVNAARSFDGGKVTLRTRALTVDAFATSVVRIMPDEFDRSGGGNRFAGAYATTARLLPRGTVEPYLFWRREAGLTGETGRTGDLEQTTAGVRLAGALPLRLEYGVELALQRGSLGTDTVRAWAGHWQVRHALPVPGAVRLTGEYNYASGDEDPTDGVRGTFDQLYPTPHDKYGLADQVGWKNMHHVRAVVEFTPRGLPILASYHSWWLAERRDGVYNAGSATLARIPDGAVETHVGQELDLQVTRAITTHIQAAAGYARIFTGPFLRQATPGASYSHPYLMVTYVFLAEK